MRFSTPDYHNCGGDAQGGYVIWRIMIPRLSSRSALFAAAHER
jgi:hypothetical protein